ncbi:MAG: low molecular weight phosphatase family protein [Thermoplasmata archaeon]
MSTILFVCEENSHRSIMAEAIFNSKHPAGWTAESAGVTPTGTVSKTAVQLLNAVGLKPSRTEPRPVTPEMTSRADRIITFGCLQSLGPDAQKNAVDWPIPRTHGKPLQEKAAARDEITRRVVDLIASLPASS